MTERLRSHIAQTFLKRCQFSIFPVILIKVKECNLLFFTSAFKSKIIINYSESVESSPMTKYNVIKVLLNKKYITAIIYYFRYYAYKFIYIFQIWFCS